LFFSIPHLDILRQSIHRPSFEGAESGQQSMFLLVSLYCLSALYISETDVQETFNGETASDLSQRLALNAQQYSRDTSDQPSGMFFEHLPSFEVGTMSLPGLESEWKASLPNSDKVFEKMMAIPADPLQFHRRKQISC
jgi:hypothetical protein